MRITLGPVGATLNTQWDHFNMYLWLTMGICRGFHNSLLPHRYGNQDMQCHSPFMPCRWTEVHILYLWLLSWHHHRLVVGLLDRDHNISKFIGYHLFYISHHTQADASIVSDEGLWDLSSELSVSAPHCLLKLFSILASAVSYSCWDYCMNQRPWPHNEITQERWCHICDYSSCIRYATNSLANWGDN